MSEHDPAEDLDDSQPVCAETIRDLVRAKIDSGEWTWAEAMAGLQTVFTLLALDAGVPREVLLKSVAAGFDEARRP